MTLLERIHEIDAGLTLGDDYKFELAALDGVENDIQVYHRLGTPAWKTLQAREEITRLRTWIAEELSARVV